MGGLWHFQTSLLRLSSVKYYTCILMLKKWLWKVTCNNTFEVMMEEVNAWHKRSASERNMLRICESKICFSGMVSEIFTNFGMFFIALTPWSLLEFFVTKINPSSPMKCYITVRLRLPLIGSCCLGWFGEVMTFLGRGQYVRVSQSEAE